MIQDKMEQGTRKFTGWLCCVVLLVMLANIWHPFLWGPDEPREAEIARETWLDGNDVLPRFNQIPFAEKPPLYYHCVAWAFRLGAVGRSWEAPHPGGARLVSALFGLLMLAALWGFVRKKFDRQTAWIAVLVCMTMPQFYRAAHWILLDIAAGMWVTAALAVYGFLEPEKRGKRTDLLQIFFMLCAAGAFLTKGLITWVYLGTVIIPYCIWRRRLLPCRLNWTWLAMLAPVGIWVWFLWREGGVYYLHEHFVNNTVGRLLHRDLHLPGSPVTVFDIGLSSPWSFYLERSPNMFGAAVLLIPLILGAAYRVLRFRGPVEQEASPGKWRRFWDALTAPRHELSAGRRDCLVYLLCWSFLPPIIFSLSAAKEVTYILPSYAGLAALCAWYVQEHVEWRGTPEWSIPVCLVLPCLLWIVTAQWVAPVSLPAFLIGAGAVYAVMAVGMVYGVRRRCAGAVLLLILTGLIGGVIIGNTPALMRRTRLNRKCYDKFSIRLWHMVGARKLFLFECSESIRGALPFYGNRPVWVLPDTAQLRKCMEEDEPHAILLENKAFQRQMRNGRMRSALTRYEVVCPESEGKADTFVLLLRKTEQSGAPAVP